MTERCSRGDQCPRPHATVAGVCSRCERAAYCSRRCQALAWYVEGHERACAPQQQQQLLVGLQTPPALPPVDPAERLRLAESVDADALLILARRDIDQGRALAAQGHAPPHVWQWTLPPPRHKASVVVVPAAQALVTERRFGGIVSARPEAVGLGIALLEPRLAEPVYVLFGKADLDVQHPHAEGRGHRFVGRRQLGLVSRQAERVWAGQLGESWALLHYAVACDGNGAMVITELGQAAKAGPWITVDASRCALQQQATTADDRARAMLLLPLIPEPLEAPDLFAAFADAYRETAEAAGGRGDEAEATLAAVGDWADGQL